MSSRWQRFAWATALALANALAADADEVRVAAATNFTPTMRALVAEFEARTHHTVVVSFGSTGNHYAQIKNGAPFDAFFAADAQRPQLLERDGVAVHGSRFLYAAGRLALWSKRAGYVDGGGQVLGGDYRHLAIANPELAPYGAAAREVLRTRGLWEGLQGRIVQGQDVGQTYALVATGNAELGFVSYAQIKKPDGEQEGSYWLVPESLHAPIAQEAVLLRDVPAARALLEFVKSDDARTIIRSYGYGP